MRQNRHFFVLGYQWSALLRSFQIMALLPVPAPGVGPYMMPRDAGCTSRAICLRGSRIRLAMPLRTR